mgnify:CR=1 FL=1
MDCLFCKIAKGEIANHTVYEDKNVLAFLDIFPHAKGHTIVIPKKHADSLEGLDENSWKDISVGLKKVLDKINDVLKPDATNIAINNGQVAGQEVPHVHWHVLPRWKTDKGGSSHSIVKNNGDKTVEEVAKLFTK